MPRGALRATSSTRRNVSETTLTAVLRTEFGKGAARRARRAGTIPAVLYGHGTAPVHLALPAHDAFLAIKGHANALLSLAFEGRTELALVKDVQRDPVKAVIEHIDLVLVSTGEQVAVDVPVTLVGEPVPGTVPALDVQTLRLLADATHIPEHVEVSVAGLPAGTILRAGELELPASTRLETDPDTVILSITLPSAQPVVEETTTETLTGATAAAEE
jgi:large subunit ribosomal protein L25